MGRPEWMVKAARKIDGLYYEWFLDKLTKTDFPEPDERVPLIETIIEKYCPEEFSQSLWAKMCVKEQAAEKLAGKLVEVLQKITPSYTTVKNRDLYDRAWYQRQYDKLQKIAEDALAEYEKATKRPPSEESHTPSSSGEPHADEPGINKKE